MSGRLVGEVLDHAPNDLTSAQMLVLVAIAETAHDKDRRAAHADVTLAGLVRRTRLKEQTVKNALRTLRQRGIIRAVHDNVHRGKAQAYEVARLAKHHRYSTWDNVHPIRTG